MPREHQDPKGLSRMLALARKRKWLYSWMTQKVSEEGTDGLTEDGPPLSGVPLPQDTSQLHLLQKGLLARGCTTAGSSSHLLDPGQMEVVVPGWGQRRWPARDPNRPPPLGPGASKEVVTWHRSKQPPCPLLPPAHLGETCEDGVSRDSQTSGPVFRQMGHEE